MNEFFGSALAALAFIAALSLLTIGGNFFNFIVKKCNQFFDK